MKIQSLAEKSPYLFLTLVYLWLNWSVFQASPIYIYADSYTYIGLAEHDFFSEYAWRGTRPFGLGLLYRLIGPRNYEAITHTQLLLSLAAWIFFAGVVAWKMKPRPLKWAAFAGILAFSLQAEMAMWHRQILSESLTHVWVALLLAYTLVLLDRLSQAPQLNWRQQVAWALPYSLLLILFSSTRDTNSYYLIFAAGLLLIAYVLLWPRLRPLTPLLGVLVSLMVGIFLVQDYTAGLSGRHELPLLNVITGRILANPEQRAYFQERGMPFDEVMLDVAGADLVTHSDSEQWDDLQLWIAGEGENEYMRYLILHPQYSLVAIIEHWQSLYTPDVMREYARQHQNPAWQNHLNRLLFDWRGFILAALLLIFGRLAYLLFRWQAWQLRFLIPAFLLVASYPLFFVVWHADPNDLDRHAITVALMTRLAGLFFILMSLDALWSKLPPRQLRRLLGSLAFIFGLGIVLELGFYSRPLRENVIYPTASRLLPQGNVLAAWEVDNSQYFSYQVLPEQAFFWSYEKGYLYYMGWEQVLDNSQAPGLDRQSLAEWRRTGLSGYLLQTPSPYVFLSAAMAEDFSDFQLQLFENPRYYAQLGQWGQNRLYQAINPETSFQWPGADPASLGLSAETYQAFMDSPGLLPAEALVFSPLSNQLIDWQLAFNLGQFIEITQQPQLFPLLHTARQVRYESELNLTPQQAAALSTWRTTKAGPDLQAAGLEYLLVDSRWWSFLSETEALHIEKSGEYTLIAEWGPDEVPGFYRLYQVRPPE